jgi:hypothetical protein
MWLYWYFLRQWQVIIQLFTEVPVLSQESERSWIYVIGISNLSISTIFLLIVWNFSYSVIIFYHFIIGCKNCYDDVPATGPPKEILQAEQYCFWAWGQPETVLTIVDLSWKYQKINEQIKIKRQWLRPWGTSEIHGSFHGSPGPVAMQRMNPISKALLCTTLDSVNPVPYPSIDAILCVKHASSKRYC